MSVLLILVVILGLYLLVKVVGFVFKLVLLVLVLGALYWLFATHLGMPLPA